MKKEAFEVHLLKHDEEERAVIREEHEKNEGAWKRFWRGAKELLDWDGEEDGGEAHRNVGAGERAAVLGEQEANVGALRRFWREIMLILDGEDDANRDED